MLDEIKDMFGRVFDFGNAFSVMQENPAGVIGLFLMPLIIMGFFMAENYAGTLNPVGAEAFQTIGQTPYCQAHYHYGLINSLVNPSEIPVKIQCMMTNFNILVLLSYYLQLFVLIFIGAVVAINLKGL